MDKRDQGLPIIRLTNCREVEVVTGTIDYKVGKYFKNQKNQVMISLRFRQMPESSLLCEGIEWKTIEEAQKLIPNFVRNLTRNLKSKEYHGE